MTEGDPLLCLTPPDAVAVRSWRGRRGRPLESAAELGLEPRALRGDAQVSQAAAELPDACPVRSVCTWPFLLHVIVNLPFERAGVCPTASWVGVREFESSSSPFQHPAGERCRKQGVLLTWVRPVLCRSPALNAQPPASAGPPLLLLKHRISKIGNVETTTYSCVKC